jgi:CheY-like chemotaxis protein
MARILVVDDEERVRANIACMLHRIGHVVTLAEDGEDALEKFLPNHFDLVITDIVMPRREGIETLRLLRQTEPMIRIIAMASSDGLDQGLYLKAAVALGADATLQKPFTAVELCHIVKGALATPQAETAALWYRAMPDWVSPLSVPAGPSDPPRMPPGLPIRNS